MELILHWLNSDTSYFFFWHSQKIYDFQFQFLLCFVVVAVVLLTGIVPFDYITCSYKDVGILRHRISNLFVFFLSVGLLPGQHEFGVS